MTSEYSREGGVAVWREHFEEVLNGGEEMIEEMQDGRERSAGEESGLLSECIHYEKSGVHGSFRS